LLIEAGLSKKPARNTDVWLDKQDQSSKTEKNVAAYSALRKEATAIGFTTPEINKWLTAGVTEYKLARKEHRSRPYVDADIFSELDAAISALREAISKKKV
jgi:hypothetical protein